MRTIVIIGITAVLLGTLQVQSAGEQPEPWKQLYTGSAAENPNVIALWQFLPGKETEDTSGRGHALQLRGDSVFAEDGLFGACLLSFPADAKNDRAQGASTPSSPDLSPRGPFALEMWFRLRPEAELVSNAFLIDKKYYHYAKDIPRANWDYCLYMTRKGTGKWGFTASLGFGTDSVWTRSRTVEITTDEWRHIAFTYDGAGTCCFFLDGEPIGRGFHEGRGAVTPGTYELVIGDRVGSTHSGFPGSIDQVRILAEIPRVYRAGLTASVSAGRTAFFRMESPASVTVRVVNDSPDEIRNAIARIDLGGATVVHELGLLAERRECTIEIPFDTRLKPGRYPLSITLEGLAGDTPLSSTVTRDVHLLPRPLPEQMPVVMWGSGDCERLNDIGFTHRIDQLADYARIWNAGEPTQAMDTGAVEEKMAMLNDLLVHGLRSCVSLYPGRWVERNEKLNRYLRVDANGVPYPHHNVSAGHPDVQHFAYNTGASVVRTFGAFPALDAALIHSEIRDGTSISFHAFEQEAAKQALGFSIPPEALGKDGIAYAAIPGFPTDRVIPDDDRLLAFYTWFWKDGDGWNPLHTQVHRGLKSTGRNDLWTFFDPAVRVPSVWGNGGEVDVISQWTYSYPDPIKIGQATDELFAMADGQPGQQVMKMTQIIWYRSGTAPNLPEDENRRSAWEREIPDAKFITIAPDHLREAFWSKISRPIRGIMYHGWGSLYPEPHGSYRHTNPVTHEVLRELVTNVVRPLGPMLLHVPDRPADVAILESFSSQIFAGRGTRGWSGSWEADMHLICQWAGLQPRILYDEHVRRGDLAGIRVLFMPCCDVLTRSVVAEVQAFQNRGGLVISDENLCPAVNPDIIIESCKRSGEAREGKDRLLAKADELRHELDPFYDRYAVTSNPDLVPRVRRYGSADYVFVLNDRRTYGDYVGHHRKVMEKGLPNQGTLRLRHPRAHVYDLLAHRAVETDGTDEDVSIPVNLGPGDGRLFLVLDQEISHPVCRTPETVLRGESFSIEIAVTSRQGEPVAAVIPLELQVTDPLGNPAERSGYYAAVDGTLAVVCDAAANDLPGNWTVTVTDLASGQTCRNTLRME